MGEDARDALDVCFETSGSFRLVRATMHTKLFRRISKVSIFIKKGQSLCYKNRLWILMIPAYREVLLIK